MTARAVVSTFSAGRAPSQLAGWWLGAAIILAYANAVTLPFVFDDVSATVNNPTIRSLHEAWSAPPAGTSTVNRPVANLTLALNHVISGDAPWSYHATNVLLHALAALTLAGLVRRTLLLPGCGGRYNARSAAHIGACAALLWSVHPLLTAAVTPVAQRTEVLCGWLYLGVFYGFVRGLEQRQPWRWWAPAVGACALGMGAKEVMVTAPLLLLWFDLILLLFLVFNWARFFKIRNTFFECKSISVTRVQFSNNCNFFFRKVEIPFSDKFICISEMRTNHQSLSIGCRGQF